MMVNFDQLINRLESLPHMSDVFLNVACQGDKYLALGHNYNCMN